MCFSLDFSLSGVASFQSGYNPYSPIIGGGGYRRSVNICSHRMCGNKHDVEEWGEDATPTFDEIGT